MSHLKLIPLLLLLAACEGPTGPQGEPGPIGPTGNDGSPAEVTVVSFTLSAAQFSNSGSIESYTRTTPEITQSIANTGLVLAFVKTSPTSTATPLPLVLPTSSGTVNLTYTFAAGQVTVQIIRSGGSAVASVFDGAEIRLAIVANPAAKMLDEITAIVG